LISIRGKEMALIHCTECNKEISDKAATCPHCGAPTATAPSSPKTIDPNACMKCGTNYIAEKKAASFSPVVLLTAPMLLFGLVLLVYNWLAALIVMGLAFMIDHFGRSKKTVLICPKCGYQPN